MPIDIIFKFKRSLKTCTCYSEMIYKIEVKKSHLEMIFSIQIHRFDMFYSQRKILFAFFLMYTFFVHIFRNTFCVLSLSLGSQITTLPFHLSFAYSHNNQMNFQSQLSQLPEQKVNRSNN